MISSASDAVERLAEQLQQTAEDFEGNESGIGKVFDETRDSIDAPVASGVSGESSSSVDPRVSINIARRLGG